MVLTYYNADGRPVCGASYKVEIDESCIVKPDCCEITRQWVRQTAFGPRFLINAQGEAGDTVIITIGSNQHVFTISNDCEIQQFNVLILVKQCSVNINVKIRKAGTGEICDSSSRVYSLCEIPDTPIGPSAS